MLRLGAIAALGSILAGGVAYAEQPKSRDTKAEVAELRERLARLENLLQQQQEAQESLQQQQDKAAKEAEEAKARAEAEAEKAKEAASRQGRGPPHARFS